MHMVVADSQIFSHFYSLQCFPTSSATCWKLVMEQNNFCMHFSNLIHSEKQQIKTPELIC